MATNRILIVDDNESILFTLKLYIKRILPGYQVITASDGPAALTEFRQQPFALVLTDYDMPQMDGLDLTLAVKQIASDSRIILMTSFSYDDIRTEPGASDLAAFLTKPFSMAQLKETLEGIGIL